MIGSRGIGSNYGGIERVLDHLCPELAALGHQLDVYCREDLVVPYRDGIRSIPTPSVGGKHFENLSRSSYALLRSVRRCDLIHFHAVGPGILSSATRLLHQPSIVTVHALDQRREKWGPGARICLSLAERTLVANADAISVVSERLRRYFLERYDLRTGFIPNGMSRQPPIAAGPVLSELGLEPQRYLLFASRLTPEKGCHDLITAFNQVGTDMRLVIAGTSGASDYIASLRAQADPAKVVFAGHRSGEQLVELFSNAYLFVLPSYIEGMSMALLEALSFGIAPLVSNIPENRAVIGDTGFFFPPQDIAALRRELELLIGRPDLVASMAARLVSLRQPDWAEVASQYDRLYRRALRSRVKAAALPADLLDA